MEGQPAKIGRYEVISVIGRGGMGVVYKARDPNLDRLVAIKMILGLNPALLKRFEIEARSTAKLKHPNIVAVYDFGDQEGNPYLIMEYLEGTSLDSILSSERSLDLATKLSVCVDICNGLQYAHERGIIHRDVKPGNLMFLTDGNVKIVDFGIARMGDTGISRTELVGSLHYMSPEQFQSQPLDCRTDIFSTGVVLYQLLTGTLPFQSEGGEAAVLYRILHEDPAPLSTYLQNYPPELDEIIRKVLAKNRDLRYPSARALAVDLLAELEKQNPEEVQHGSATQIISGPRLRAPTTAERTSKAASTTRNKLRTVPLAPDIAPVSPSSGLANAANRTSIFIAIGVLAILAIAIIAWRIMRHNATSTLAPVEITTTPAGASVQVEGTNQNCITPHCTLNLAPGDYEVKAKLQGYEDVNQTIVVKSPGPNPVQIVLNAVPVTPKDEAPNTAGGENGNTSVNESQARLQINGATNGSEVFVDGKPVGTVDQNGAFSTNVLPGDHKIKLQSGNKESVTIAQHFSAANELVLNGSDFPFTAAPPTTEQAEWQRVKDSKSLDEVAQFLRRYPRGTFRPQAERKIEDLYWAKDQATDTPTALREYLGRYPGGTHSQAANAELARLEWQAIANTKDPASLEGFLRIYPSGEYHDKASSRLDDLLWERTGRGDDVGSLRSYLSSLPAGKHADQVRKELDQLNAPKEVANGTQPAHVTEAPRGATQPVVTSSSPTDDKTAILGVLTAYEKSYEGQDLAGLQKLWPSMGPKTVQALADFFKSASSIKLTYIVLDGPKIAGNDATLEFKQETSYVMSGKFQKPTGSKVNMKLKRTNPEGNWQIDSIR